MQYLLFSWDVWVSTITSKVFAFVTNIWLSLQHPQSLTNTSDIYWLLPVFKVKTMPRTTHPSAAETCETLCFIFFPLCWITLLSHMSVNWSSFTLSRSVWTRLMWLMLTKGPLPPDIKHERCSGEKKKKKSFVNWSVSVWNLVLFIQSREWMGNFPWVIFLFSSAADRNEHAVQAWHCCF